MSVWYSEQTTCVETENGVQSGVRIIILDSVLNSDGEFSIDLSPYNITTIFDYSLKVLDAATTLTQIVLTQVNTITNTLITGVAGIVTNTTVSLGLLLKPLTAAVAGTKIRVTLFCK